VLGNVGERCPLVAVLPECQDGAVEDLDSSIIRTPVPFGGWSELVQAIDLQQVAPLVRGSVERRSRNEPQHPVTQII
jgi:hypothetical protein